LVNIGFDDAQRQNVGPIRAVLAMNFLIVEDSDPMRRAIRNFIEGLVESLSNDKGCRIFECSDGAQALAEYAKHRPDWVLMDIKMKHVDGLAATRQITTLFPEARIVIVTSYDEASFRDEARQAGACGYVLKENLLELESILGSITPAHDSS